MITPLHDRILVKRVNIEVKSKGGILLGEIESERDVCYGIVVETGEGKQIDTLGKIPLTVVKGDLVAFNDSIAKRINYKEEFFMVRESDVYCIIKDNDINITDFQTEAADEKRPMRMV